MQHNVQPKESRPQMEWTRKGSVEIGVREKSNKLTKMFTPSVNPKELK